MVNKWNVKLYTLSFVASRFISYTSMVIIVGVHVLSRFVVCCACLNIVPLHDCIAPPFTSKVLKYIVETNEGFRNLRGLLGVRGSFKPIVFSPLWDGGRFLYSCLLYTSPSPRDRG